MRLTLFAAPLFRTTALIVTSALLAGAAPPGDAPVASDPIFHGLTIEGNVVTGRVRQLGPGGNLTLVPTDGPERVIPLHSLVKLTREGPIPPLTPEASVVLFPDGDRLFRTVLGAADETSLKVQSYAIGDVIVPLENILGLVFALPGDANAVASMLQRVRGEPRTSEVLWLANGDRITGGFLGLNDRTVEFQPGKEPVKLERGGIVALGFDPNLVTYSKPDGDLLDLTFIDGSRLGVSDLRVEEGHVLGKTRFGAMIRVPINDVARAYPRTASVVYLADREPAGSIYVPYVGPPRPFRRDAAVDGQPMRLSGQEFDRGLGTESRTILVYRLEPGDKRFQATVGLDDRAGPLGSVVFRVMVDNRERFASPPMSARDAPLTIDLDLEGAKRLILLTEFGDRGGVRDLADWVEARIIR